MSRRAFPDSPAAPVTHRLHGHHVKRWAQDTTTTLESEKIFCRSTRDTRHSLSKRWWSVDEVAIGSYLPRMRSVGIKVLNSRLSEYVRLAASGETILVTDRDRVVAELGPLRETRSPILADAFLADAVRSGVLTPPVLAASGPPPKPAPVARLDEVLAELDENRRDR